MRIENGKLVFDRYATEEEMKYLRVNADGVVEGAQIKMPVDDRIFQKLIDVRKDLDIYWVKMDDTHFVEWGLPNGIYQFNTYRCIKSVSSYSPTGTVFTAMFDDIISEFYLMSANDSVRLCSVADGFDSYFEYIGNVWGSKWS